jgi:hypothetical protein
MLGAQEKNQHPLPCRFKSQEPRNKRREKRKEKKRFWSLESGIQRLDLFSLLLFFQFPNQLRVTPFRTPRHSVVKPGQQDYK